MPSGKRNNVYTGDRQQDSNPKDSLYDESVNGEGFCPPRGRDNLRDCEDPRPELVTFSCKEAYVYKAPPATTVGHRAELWDVDNPMQEVACGVVTTGDDCWVRLSDKQSGELFAECPIVRDKPLTASVEPVIDSSRYFVLRAVHRESGRHAFLGFGFRERSHATDFNAALSDHMGYLRRQLEARQMQEAFRAAQDGQQGPNLPTLDFSLKPGETVSLKLADKAPIPRSSFLSKRLAGMTISEPGHSGTLLPPPPSGQKLEAKSLSGPLQDERSLPASSASHTHESVSDGEQQQAGNARKEKSRHNGGHPSSIQQHADESVSVSKSASCDSPDSEPRDEEDDQFGNFVEA